MKAPTYETSGSHRRLTYTPSKPEQTRVYLFPGGDRIEITGVVRAQASRHGNHQLTTADGTVHVIPWGWISLSFPAESQTTPEEVITRGEITSLSQTPRVLHGYNFDLSPGDFL